MTDSIKTDNTITLDLSLSIASSQGLDFALLFSYAQSNNLTCLNIDAAVDKVFDKMQFIAKERVKECFEGLQASGLLSFNTEDSCDSTTNSLFPGDEIKERFENHRISEEFYSSFVDDFLKEYKGLNVSASKLDLLFFRKVKSAFIHSGTVMSQKNAEKKSTTKPSPSSNEDTSTVDTSPGSAQASLSKSGNSSKVMSAEWLPREETVKALLLENIPINFTKDLVLEFVNYWIDRGSKAVSWDAKFIKHAKGQWLRNKDAQSPVKMDVNWQPSYGTVEDLVWNGFDREMVKGCIPAFVRYWLDNGMAHASWNGLFCGHVQRTQDYYDGLDKKDYLTGGQGLMERLLDTSWGV